VVSVDLEVIAGTERGLKGFSLFALFAYLAAGNFAIIMAGASFGRSRLPRFLLSNRYTATIQ
jgi:hypothetical protein